MRRRAGAAALVRRITEKLATENGIDVGRGSAVMVTAGANMAFMHAVLAVTCPGDEVIVPVPFYFNHEMAIEMVGCRVVRVKTDDRYQLDLDAIRSALTDRTRVVVTVSPNNPSGAVLAGASLRALRLAFFRSAVSLICFVFIRRSSNLRILPSVSSRRRRESSP
jgi:aspartate/methionine/tyrosine aminotransferase